MKYIYVIFSAVDLKIGRMIRLVTRNDYSHCSVCLREDLSQFYSFSRLYRSNPLIGGFTAESPMRYTLSSRTMVKIVTVPVSEPSFERARQVIKEMRDNAEQYVYNFFSAAAYLFGRSFDSDNAFTCAEFTSSVLKAAGVYMPKMANIEQMENVLSDYPTWEGRAVDGLPESIWGEDRYLDRIGKRRQCVLMARGIKRLVAGKAQ